MRHKMWGVGIGPPQIGTRSMENLISLLVNNPDIPITIPILIWIIIQVNKVKTRIDTMQNNIDHLLRAIIFTKLTKHEGTNNRHETKDY